MNELFFSRSFTLTNNSLPKISNVPTCYFGKKASGFWNLRDYSSTEKDNSFTPSEFIKHQRKKFELQESDLYRYKKCTSFSPKPSNLGVCHTFNGLKLSEILKDSRWTSAFLKSFGSYDSGELYKSTGIDLHDGFVFSLDTMQSYIVNMEKRTADQAKLNAFYIKVHPAGEIPWITKDRSSWKKISAFSNEMSNRFITLKGEKIVGKVNFQIFKESLSTA